MILPVADLSVRAGVGEGSGDRYQWKSSQPFSVSAAFVRLHAAAPTAHCEAVRCADACSPLSNRAGRRSPRCCWSTALTPRS
eukprot:SAG11_NODE_29082_length_314_cov_2.316279_1_plen_81_part_01